MVAMLEPNHKDVLLTAAHLTLEAGSKRLLQDVSLTLGGGEIIGLIGPNGAGKTSLLKVLCGLGKAASGTVLLNGRPMATHTPRQIARLIAQVQQNVVLDAPFSVQDVVAMGRNPHLGRFQVETERDQTVIERAMRLTSTRDLALRLITTLSGGERQRVFLARALAQEPSILLLDEPTSNLDIRHQIEIMALVQSFAHEQGLAVLVAIHDLALAGRFCDRLLLLHDGELMAEGTPEAVLNPANLRQAFGVHAQPYHDPFTNHLKLSINMEQLPEPV